MVFADGVMFRGQWEEGAWLQSAADPALCRLRGPGLARAAAGHKAEFGIKVRAKRLRMCYMIHECCCTLLQFAAHPSLGMPRGVGLARAVVPQRNRVQYSVSLLPVTCCTAMTVLPVTLVCHMLLVSRELIKYSLHCSCVHMWLLLCAVSTKSPSP